MQAQKNDELPNCANWIIPDQLAKEVCGKEPEKFPGAAIKLLRLVNRNRGRLFAGFGYSELIDRESEPDAESSLVDAVNWDATVLMASSELPSLDELERRASEERSALRAEEDQRVLFVKWREEFESEFRRINPGQVGALGGSLALLHQEARRPELVVELIQRHYPDKSGAVWGVALSVFPDKLAVGRFCRLLSWYALRRLSGVRKDPNDWDDCAYAFLASYAGALASDDGRLKETVRAVFPTVRIHGSNDHSD